MTTKTHSTWICDNTLRWEPTQLNHQLLAPGNLDPTGKWRSAMTADLLTTRHYIARCDMPVVDRGLVTHLGGYYLAASNIT
jgi:hypothetical protein